MKSIPVISLAVAIALTLGACSDEGIRSPADTLGDSQETTPPPSASASSAAPADSSNAAP